MLKTNEKTKKIGKIIGILCAIVIVALTCVFATSANRRTYFSYRFLTSNYQEQIQRIKHFKCIRFSKTS